MRFVMVTALIAACGATPTPRERPAASQAAPSQVCVVRHAEAWKNVSPLPDGLAPAELDALTPAGEAQARALTARLPQGVQRTWASPTGRTRQTAALLGTPGLEVTPDLRPLDGDLPWEDRARAWRAGDDPRPDGGESLADGRARALAVLARARAALPPGAHAVLVTHGDLAALLLGELRGTPLLDRPARDALATGELACLPLPPEGLVVPAPASR